MRGRASAAWLMVTMSVASGCASYILPALPLGHPARADGPTGQDPAPSRTLAYTQADIPSVEPVSSIAATTHGGHTASSAERHPRTVVGEGEVVSTVPNASQIVVDHGVIDGFMEAMTMAFEPEDPEMLNGVSPGDHVRFMLRQKGDRLILVAIEKSDSP